MEKQTGSEISQFLRKSPWPYCKEDLKSALLRVGWGDPALSLVAGPAHQMSQLWSAACETGPEGAVVGSCTWKALVSLFLFQINL